MLQEPTVVQSESAQQPTTTHVVHALMQFLVAVRYRKHVVLVALAVASVLGAVYYFTATPYFAANARILVMGSGQDGDSIGRPLEGNRQTNLMLTFENLFDSAKVVQGALPYLRREDRIDFAGAPPEAWPGILQRNLSAQAIQGTNLLEVSYRSKDPKAAVSVIKAVIQSYREFLDETHQSTAKEVAQVLTKERADLTLRLDAKNQELLAARAQTMVIGATVEGEVVHPLAQRAKAFNEALIETQKQRIELDASLAAIKVAIRNGADLQQHVMSVADVVGKEVLLQTLGISPGGSYAQAEMERQLLESKADLKTLLEHLGPNHPEVIAKTDRIRMTEQYLLTYRQRISSRLKAMTNNQIGPMLVEMVQQKLSEMWHREQSLQAQYDDAQQQAINLNGRLAHIDMIEHELKWLRELHDILLEKLANINLKQGGQEIRTAVVQEPMEAKAPFSPSARRIAALVLLGGIAAGMGMVYVLDILDDRFRSVEELQQQLNVPVLTMIRQLPSSDCCGAEALQMHVAPNSTECEAFRTLRTALALADREARQLVVSSAEPGDGKTTMLANLAVAYAQSNKRTLLIDADLRRPGLTAMMGMRGVDGLSSVIRDDGDVVQMATANIRATGVDRLDVLPSGLRPTNPAELLASPRFAELLAWAETVYDQILIDSPPTLATSDTVVIGRLVDGVVMVVQPDKNRRRTVIRAKDSLIAMKIPLLGIVINRVGAENDRGYYGYESGYGYGYGYEYSPDEDDADALDGDCLAEQAGDNQGDGQPGNGPAGDKQAGDIVSLSGRSLAKQTNRLAGETISVEQESNVGTGEVPRRVG